MTWCHLGTSVSQKILKLHQKQSGVLTLFCTHASDAFEHIQVSISVACKSGCACDWNSSFFNDPYCVRVNVSLLGPNCKASTDPWLILRGKHCKAGWGTSENSNRLWLHNSSLYCWERTEISDPLKSLGNRNYSISQQHQVFTSLSLNQESPDLRLLWPLPFHSSAIILTSFP